MNRSFYKPAVWLMWLAFAMTALNSWRAWDQLPMRMAVHFDANWQPNGYTSREGAVMLGLGAMGVLVLSFTISALIVHALKPSSAWPMLIVFYIVIAILWYVNDSIVKWNLQQNEQAPRAALVSRSGGRIHPPALSQ
ncbi:MAG TPA: DUF1648 domain-containing protein [Candidatus Sulfotelmatobacter sp.]|jgi:uncharacterized membrane protein